MSRCGDGIVVNEACDDGNNVDGDGCTAACKIEPGFMCKQPALGDKMVVPAVYRDFRAKMPADFEPSASGRMTAVTGMVQTMLDMDGKPVYVNVANSLRHLRRDLLAVVPGHAGREPHDRRHAHALEQRPGAIREPLRPERRAVDRHRAGLLLRQCRREKIDAAGNPIPCTSVTLPRRTAPKWTRLA